MRNIEICPYKEKFYIMSKKEFDLRIQNAYLNGIQKGISEYIEDISEYIEDISEDKRV